MADDDEKNKKLWLMDPAKRAKLTCREVLEAMDLDELKKDVDALSASHFNPRIEALRAAIDRFVICRDEERDVVVQRVAEKWWPIIREVGLLAVSGLGIEESRTTTVSKISAGDPTFVDVATTFKATDGRSVTIKVSVPY